MPKASRVRHQAIESIEVSKGSYLFTGFPRRCLMRILIWKKRQQHLRRSVDNSRLLLVQLAETPESIVA